MFTWLDLVAPIGICCLAAFLCYLGFRKSKKIPPKLVCAITGGFFLAFIPLWYVVRDQKIEPDYTSGYGLEVVQGVKNKCEKKQIDEWSKWLIDLWSGHYDVTCVRTSLKGKLVVCVDEEKLSVLGRAVRGYSHGRFSVVGWNGKISYAESLFKHEVSHQIIGSCVMPFHEEEHHKLFKEKGLEH